MQTNNLFDKDTFAYNMSYFFQSLALQRNLKLAIKSHKMRDDRPINLQFKDKNYTRTIPNAPSNTKAFRIRGVRTFRYAFYLKSVYMKWNKRYFLPHS